MNIFMLIEAVNSVALEHDPSCDCIACRAAGGDQDALAQVAATLKQGEIDNG